MKKIILLLSILSISFTTMANENVKKAAEQGQLEINTETARIVREYNNSICKTSIEFLVQKIQLEISTSELQGKEVDIGKIEEMQNNVIEKCTKN